jgi:outer membrane lipoprotein-sorting protein
VETLHADLEGSVGAARFSGTVLLRRPNLARVEIKGDEELGEFLVIANGKEIFVYFPGANGYTRARAEPNGRNIHTFIAEPVDYFFRPDEIGTSPEGGRSRYAGTESIDGVQYEVIEVVGSSPRNERTRYFISPQDHLVHERVTTARRKDGSTTKSRIRLRNVRSNTSIDGSMFGWAPPPTAEPLQMPAGVALPLGSSKGRSGDHGH